MLEAEIVRLYALYRERQSASVSLGAALDLSDQRQRDMAQRVEAGLAEQSELWEMEAAHNVLRAEQAVAYAGLQSARNQLLAAVGVSPVAKHPLSEALAEPGALPVLPEPGDYRLPEDFLSRRPDVLVAEARLRAAIGETALAERASLPSLNLLGSLASIAPFGQFGDAATRSLAVGPVIEWNWLSFGRNQLRETAARFGEQAAAAAFEATILRAVSDADSAIRAWQASRQASRQAWVETVEAAKKSEQTHRRMRSRFDAGLEPRVAAVTTELEYREWTRRAARSQAEALAAYASLQLALGVDIERDHVDPQ